MAEVPLVSTSSLTDETFDCVVLLISSVEDCTGPLAVLKTVINDYVKVDSGASSSVSVIVTSEVCGMRLIYSPTGPLNRDEDDVRRIYDAAEAGIKRALSAGSKKPLLVSPMAHSFADADLCAILGALHALYVPLEIREATPIPKKKADVLGWWSINDASSLLRRASGLEAGRNAARDIGGSDPERMAPPRVSEYVEALFGGEDSSVSIEVIEGHENFVREYPLLAAVDRACRDVERHKGRVIWLTYQGSGEVKETVMIVGKGVCYDTGGADIKAGGVMAGMHRDKCGAAAVAGFFKMLDVLKPSELKVVGAMCMVRNSVGSECYVADEIITSRAGCRVRVGNTDAEGRMAMTDVLCHMKEKALLEIKPKLFTWATLTGHAIIAHGSKYSAVMGNGPSCMAELPEQLIRDGRDMAEPCALSTIVREDYTFAKGKSEYEDVLQCNNQPSSRTPRGHQFPAAFMILASGLKQHGKDSAKPLSYTHVDVAGSSGPFPGIPTAAPVLAFAKTFVLHHLD
ncbi:putative aminopeptidase W07G4.4 isoform X2 [Watersipora subatra]